jgi:hypothetical protein
MSNFLFHYALNRSIDTSTKFNSPFSKVQKEVKFVIQLWPGREKLQDHTGDSKEGEEGTWRQRKRALKSKETGMRYGKTDECLATVSFLLLSKHWGLSIAYPNLRNITEKQERCIMVLSLSSYVQ